MSTVLLLVILLPAAGALLARMVTAERSRWGATAAAAISAVGMLATTMRALRQSRRNTRIIKPVSPAPSAPSSVRPPIARVTYGDWSNS